MWHNWNGQNCKSIELGIQNRSFRYGDGLFESLRLFNGKVFNRKNHERRLEKSLQLLSLELNVEVNHLFDRVEELALTNSLSQGSSARITIYREGEGLYTPQQDKASYVIQTFKEATNLFLVNACGLNVDFYSEYKKQKNLLSNIKSANSLIYVLASLEKKKLQLDDLLLFNDSEYLAESTNSNLFMLKEGKLFTPPLTDAPLDGCMRKLVIDTFKVHQKSITKDELLLADEIFLSNSKGIRWVGSIKDKSFIKSSYSKTIVDQLNTLI